MAWHFSLDVKINCSKYYCLWYHITNPFLQEKYLEFVRLVPVSKGPDSTSVSNYRPIPLLVISKLLERHMHYLISHHIETFCPIAFHQWAFNQEVCCFCPKWCCSSLASWYLTKDRIKVAAVFFDKAFHFVPHRPLLDKLTSTGLTEYLAIVKWTCNYLCNRNQHDACLNGHKSASLPVISGYPRTYVGLHTLFCVSG